MARRTTLSIDDDVLAYARQLSEVSGRPLGDVISELARNSMSRPGRSRVRNGIELLPVGDAAGKATLETVNALRDEAL